MKLSKSAQLKLERDFNRQKLKEYEHKFHQEDRQKAIKEDFRLQPMEDEKDILDKISDQVSKKEPIIELFDIKNIKLKANITEEQRNIIVILMATYNQAVVYGVDLSCIKLICADFVELSPSIDGKRAEQYVDAHRQVLNQLMPNSGQFGQYGNYSDKMQQMRK